MAQRPLSLPFVRSNLALPPRSRTRLGPGLPLRLRPSIWPSAKHGVRSKRLNVSVHLLAFHQRGSGEGITEPSLPGNSFSSGSREKIFLGHKMAFTRSTVLPHSDRVKVHRLDCCVNAASSAVPMLVIIVTEQTGSAELRFQTFSFVDAVIIEYVVDWPCTVV